MARIVGIFDGVVHIESDIEPEDLDERIANYLWHDCGEWIECKTSDLEPLARGLIEHLREHGYVIFERSDEQRGSGL